MAEELELWVPQGDRDVAAVSTGESLELASATDGQLALVRATLVRVRHLLDASSAMVDSELAARLDRDNRRSMTVDGIELTVNAPHAVEWDIERLRATLDELVDEGRLGAGVPPRVVKATVTYKVAAVEVRKLLEHDDPRIAERIRECRTVVPARRRVTVNT